MLPRNPGLAGGGELRAEGQVAVRDEGLHSKVGSLRHGLAEMGDGDLGTRTVAAGGDFAMIAGQSCAGR